MSTRDSSPFSVITTHVSADFDSLASMIAAKKLYPEASIVFPGSIEQNVKEFISLHKGFLGLKSMKEINLDKISRLIIVDTRQASRIGDFNNIVKKKGLKIYLYDHHPQTSDDLKGEVNVAQEIGATTSILVEMLKKKKVALTSLEATILLMGIYEDTGSLIFGSTSPQDLEAGAYLLKKGANLNMASDFINPGLSPAQIALLNLLHSQMEFSLINGVRIAIAKTEAKGYKGSLSLIVHKLRDMENINVLFALIKLEDRLQIIARSRLKEVNVGEILAIFGGGGHSRAASATLQEKEINQVEKKLKKVLGQKIKPLITSRDIMSAPVKTIPETLSLKEAGKVILHFNFSALPVARQGRLFGMVSRIDLDRAIEHGLGQAPVKNYMSPAPFTINPLTSLDEIRRLMIEHNTSHLPVTEHGYIQGIVTRGDLIRALHNYATKEEDFSLYPSTLIKKEVKGLLQRLPKTVQKILRQIGKAGEDLNYPCFVVGGFVRDLLLHIENLDIDIVVEGKGTRFARILAKKLKGEVHLHEQFGTAIVTIPFSGYLPGISPQGQLKIDVATARTEFYEYPAALPRVELSSIRQDLYRRDFTINAMAIRLDKEYFGYLYDFFEGERDLKERKIRVLHNLSFIDDPTRIFRCLRLSTRYNFTIEPRTLSFIKNALNLAIFDRVTNERIRDELILILNEMEPLKSTEVMQQMELLKYVHPCLRLTPEVRTLFLRINDIFSWVILYEEKGVERWLVYLLGLLQHLRWKQIEEVINKFHFSREAKEKIYISRHLRLAALNKKSILPSYIHKKLKAVPREVLLFLMARHKASPAEKHIALFLTKLAHIHLRINGEKLKQLGFYPGPQFRKILDATLEAKLNGKIKDNLREELGFVRKRWGKK